MVEEKAGIEVFVEVDPKLTAVFSDDEIVAGFAGFLVLLQTFLTFSAFKVDLFGCKTGHKTDGFQYIRKPCFVFFGLHQPAGIVFLKMDLVAVNIDGKGKLGNIAVVNAPGFDIVAFGPFHKMFDVFAQAVGKGGNVGHGFQTALLGKFPELISRDVGVAVKHIENCIVRRNYGGTVGLAFKREHDSCFRGVFDVDAVAGSAAF